MDEESAAAAAARGGDREAFGRLYDLYSGRIYAYLYYRTLRREVAEDLTATCFLKALEGLPGYRAEAGSFSAWLFGIARNALRDHWRSLPRTAALSLDASPDLWDLPDAAVHELEAENRDLWERLKPHLARLSPEQREILVLRTWDRLPYAEIAAQLGKSEAACKMSYSRTLSLLRETMSLSLLIAFLAARPPVA